MHLLYNSTTPKPPRPGPKGPEQSGFKMDAVTKILESLQMMPLKVIRTRS